MPGEAKIGTSGFSFQDWKGPVYPPTIKKQDMLPYYEKELGFNTLEVNFTYYTLPTTASIKGMMNKTSQNFKKLHRQAQKGYIMFNNCHAGSAVRNARQLKKMMGMAGEKEPKLFDR